MFLNINKEHCAPKVMPQFVGFTMLDSNCPETLK